MELRSTPCPRYRLTPRKLRSRRHIGLCKAGAIAPLPLPCAVRSAATLSTKASRVRGQTEARSRQGYKSAKVPMEVWNVAARARAHAVHCYGCSLCHRMGRINKRKLPCSHAFAWTKTSMLSADFLLFLFLYIFLSKLYFKK